MKGYGWISKVADYAHVNVGKLPKEQQRLHNMLVYPSRGSDPNYFNINKSFLKELKNQQDKEYIKIVLSWLDHGLFSDGWGLLSGGKFHGKGLSELSGTDKEQVVTILKTIKQAFIEYKFQPNYISINDKNHNINSMLKQLGAKIAGKNNKHLELKTAAQKLADGKKFPRKLKKEVAKNPVAAKLLKELRNSKTK
ncbi:MAG: hypothetical protein LBF28_02665 [Rickettsiales bacterium]|jgi:hypothetical protein|nr:hypothetical protein [Rickettsiales bacterium]